MPNSDPGGAAPGPLARAGALWEWLVAALTLALVGVTVYDVTARYFFNAPLAGGSFVIAALMAATIFAALPLATAKDEHLRAGLLDHLVRGVLVRVQARLIFAGSFLALAALAFVLWRQGVIYGRTGGEIASIRVPLSAVAYGGSVMSGVSAALVLGLALRRGGALRRG